MALSPHFLSATPQQLYVGCETSEAAPGGIYLATFDSETGALQPPRRVADLRNPSFLAIAAAGDFLYSVDEKAAGEVIAWGISPDGSLTRINAQPSGGADPCHLCISPAGAVLLAANYSGGSVAAFPIKKDGSLAARSAFFQLTGFSINPARQTSPHAHGVVCDPTGKWVYVADLGTDKIWIYRLDEASGTMTPNEPAWVSLQPGFGPRHVVLNSGGTRAYVDGEMGLEVVMLMRDPASGALETGKSLAVFPSPPEPARHPDAAEIALHPSGRTLYVSTRGISSISSFDMAADGGLSFLENVAVPVSKPRHFSISPDGKWLVIAGQEGHQITVFAVGETGKVRSTGHTIDLPGPVCVIFAPRK